jgi:hypothetical protein
MSAPKWAVGMEMLKPGVYCDSEGVLHWDPHGLLAAAGYAPTPDNLAVIERVIRDNAKKCGARLEVSED